MVVGHLKKILICTFLIIFLNQNLFGLEFKGKFEQGSFILGKTNPNSEVTIDNRKIKVSKDGFFAFGLSRERKNNVIIKVIKDNKLEVYEKKVFKRKYKIQRINWLPEKKDSEVTSDIIKGNQSIVMQQAKNRMVAQRGILKWLEI